MKAYGLLILTMISVRPALADWTVDFSRRTKSAPTANEEGGSWSSSPATTDQENDRSIFSRIFSSADSDEPVQEIAIMQTESGFVPKRIQVRQGFTYKISVVNVNEKERNVSFVLDAFSEHHATYYGKIKTFTIHPQQDGVFNFQSPETAFQGQLVVLPSEMPKATEEIKLKSSDPKSTEPAAASEVRAPASQE